MASAQLHKATITNETVSKPHEEHRLCHKISDMTAWGSRMFGHKQQEHQAVTKHCTTCQSPGLAKDKRPACTENKKEHAASVSAKETKSGACIETKKKAKEQQVSTVNKDSKCNTHIEVKKEKQHIANTGSACADMKKKGKKEQHPISNTTNGCNKMIKKEQKEDPTNHCFSSMADHWKEKIMMTKKAKPVKCKDSSNSSSDTEDETCKKKKKDKKERQETKATTK